MLYAYYIEYHTIFYLPGDVRLGKINCSGGEGIDFGLGSSFGYLLPVIALSVFALALSSLS
ncbi:MAG: hypothetical protein KAU16_04205 [Methanophagales archaeon]|nr:hypothetical protein [Methanophagales archaeon]